MEFSDTPSVVSPSTYRCEAAARSKSQMILPSVGCTCWAGKKGEESVVKICLTMGALFAPETRKNTCLALFRTGRVKVNR